MEKNLKNLFLNKIFIVICVLIILFSFFSGLLGQVFSFKEISTGDRHEGTHTIKVPEAGDAVRVPAEVEQSYGTYEGYDRSDWSYTNKTIYEKWVEQGKPASDSHWAYLNINGKPRYLVAVVPTFGQTGDYIDIDLTCDGKSVTYPCIIADSKDIWVDSAYSYNGVVYGHTSNGKCNIIEVCSELSADSSNWSSLAPLLNKLTGVTQIANGGSMLDHPDGPVGLNGNYNYEDGTSSKDASADGDDEAESFNGAIAMIVRDAWDSISATFENNIRDRNDTSVLYDIKNLSRDGSSTSSATGITDENIRAMYNEYEKNKGTPYKMDHSNFSYDTCMSYYDCSSWTIHCLAHAGVKKIPLTDAAGIFTGYCEKVEADNRQPGDLIFLQGTYKAGISHVGIYLGKMTVDGEEGEWIIDTGGNPKGVKISKYDNNWWNGSHFYAFGRLKD